MLSKPRFLIIVAAIALVPSSGMSQTVWSMPGAWPNLHTAVDSASSGDIIELADGLYDGVAWRGLSVDKTLTFRSASMDSSQCVFDCGGTYWASFEDGMPYGGSRIEGIGFRNAGGGSGDPWEGAISARGPDTITIAGCDFENNTPSSVTGYAYVENCVFRNHPLGGVAARPLQVLDSLFEYNAGYCITAAPAPPLSAGIFLDGCRFRNNSSNVMFFQSPNAVSRTIRNCDFEENTGGPAVFCPFPLVVINSTFVRNSSDTQGGGAISISSGAGNNSIIGCTFTQNTAGASGGALSVTGTGLTELIGCVFQGNIVTSTSGSAFLRGGGGAYVEGSVNVEDCTFEGNTTSGAVPTYGGGLFLQGAGDVTIGMDSRFVSNQADKEGGGIAMVRTDLSAATISLTNVLIADNAAVEEGGGLAFLGLGSMAATPTLNVTRTTIANNSLVPGSGERGSAVSINGAYLNLEQSIIAYNRGGPAFYCASTATASCTDIFGHDPPGSNWTGCLDGFESFFDNLEAQPKFCCIEDGNYELASDSPCLAANNLCGGVGLLMGWGEEGSCITSAVQQESWAAIKAMYR
ncbi:MAG: hypothetical protein DHS20C21_00020 [Gemmatimonadota bacterium]|nr:MAG: hypothetical protein DHS20C21_00020 [Gemmatimonadota bacterium]